MSWGRCVVVSVRAVVRHPVVAPGSIVRLQIRAGTRPSLGPVRHCGVGLMVNRANNQEARRLS